ncbi:MAG: thiamine phosphate synthase [Opitutaceae bacterium]|jgi:thiamine-phosphate pyrophosphorylase|nr:thiamine phosphate synthase [Opitutaceae bacterium]
MDSAKTPLRLLVISPEGEDSREHAVLAELFAAGLRHYHLRKPGWARARLAAWLRALPPEFHPRIVLHTHHNLAAEFDLGGLHERDSGRAAPPDSSRMASASSGGPGGRIRSRAVHSLAALRSALDRRERLLFSPVFPSISKPGHAPACSHKKLAALLALPRRAEVIALGGVDATRLPVCRALGFDGIAVLGSVWQAADPLKAFSELQSLAAQPQPRPSLVAPSS